MAEQRVVYIQGIGPVTVAEGQTVSDAIAASGLKPTTTEKSVQSNATPEQSSSFMGMLGDAVNTGEDFARGAFKGAGETAFNLGSGVRQIPVVGHITDALAKLIGPEGTDPDQAFAQTPEDLKARNSAESAGKTVEQIAEFFLPAGKAGMGTRLAADAVGALQKGAHPAMKAATNAAWKAGPVVDDALSAGLVSMAHGEEDPQYAAAATAAGQLLGLSASQAAKLLSTKTGQQVIPLLAAIASMSAIEGMGGGMGSTMGGGLGGFSVARAAARRALNPATAGRVGWQAEQAGQLLGTTAAGVTDQARKTRRKSEDQ